MISEGIKHELVLRILHDERLLFSGYSKLYFQDREGPRDSGIAGVITVSRGQDEVKLIRIVDISRFSVRFELEVFSNMERYMQQTGRNLVTFPIPHRSGHTLVSVQFQSTKAVSNFLESLVNVVVVQEVPAGEAVPEDEGEEAPREAEKALVGEFLKFT